MDGLKDICMGIIATAALTQESIEKMEPEWKKEFTKKWLQKNVYSCGPKDVLDLRSFYPIFIYMSFIISQEEDGLYISAYMLGDKLESIFIEDKKAIKLFKYMLARKEAE